MLFGKDAFEPSEYPYYWRVFETNDEYFDYYRDYHAFWKLYGLGLPDEVLKKIYYATRWRSRRACRKAAGRVNASFPGARLPKYLVTGGAGFIGSHVVADPAAPRRSRSASSTISRADSRENVPCGAGRPISSTGDLADPAVAARAVAGCEYVHPPGRDSVRAAVGEGSRRVAPRQRRRHAEHAPRRARRPRQAPRLRRLVVGRTATRRRCPSTRACRPNPLSPYALQKVIGEQYCQMFTRLYGLETVTTRYFNVFGPRQQPGSPYSGVISLFIEALSRRPRADDLRRRRADPRLHLRRRRRRRRAAALRGAGRRRRSDQRRGRTAASRCSNCSRRSRDSGRQRDADVRPTRAGRRPRFAGGHHQGAAPARLRRAGAVPGRSRADRRVVSHDTAAARVVTPRGCSPRSDNSRCHSALDRARTVNLSRHLTPRRAIRHGLAASIS